MRISSLVIKNFKSIKYLEINDIENALILVGKNNVGKTAIIDALKILSGSYKVQSYDFNEFNHKIVIQIKLEILEEDLKNLYKQRKVSSFKKYSLWKKDFINKIPCYKNHSVFIQCSVNKSGFIRYSDGINKDNKYLSELLPEFYILDNKRSLNEIQEAILKFHGSNLVNELKKDHCLFEKAKVCHKCFNCIGFIKNKKIDDLTINETTKLLNYKLYNLNLRKYEQVINNYMRKNGNMIYEIKYKNELDFEQLLQMKTTFYNKENHRIIPFESISEGIKSMYILSLFEAYSNESNKLPMIILIEEPEMYLHPKLQKIASEILYRLSKKNQVIFSTHAPNMLFNFSSRQIRQVILDKEHTTQIALKTNLNYILDDLGFSSNDLLNVNFVFIVEGKQDRSRLPLLLEKYYSEIYNEEGNLQRIAIITTNSCTNIKTYANLKFINQTYLKDNFLMIRDSDGQDREELINSLSNYYKKRSEQDEFNLPRISKKNVLVLKYYSFENYFLNPVIMAKIGVIKNEEDFYNILYDRYKQYLYRIKSVVSMNEKLGIKINSKEDLKKHIETVKIYVRGHNLFNIFYRKYRGKEKENNILKAYINESKREDFKDILFAIDKFIYFENRKK